MTESNIKKATKYIYLSVILSVGLLVFSQAGLISRAAGPQSPVIGNYPSVASALSGNTLVMPDSSPTGVLSLTAQTSSNFKGVINADPVTGKIQITNAYPAGSYNVKVTALGENNETISRQFSLAVEQTAAACGQAEFYQAPVYGAGNFPQAVVVEDFDGDNKKDIAVANTGVSILKNISTRGKPSFAPKIDLNTTAGGFGIVAADLDNDGKKDLVTADFYNGKVSVYRNTSSAPGNLTFDQKVDVGTGASPRGINAADFDGDGKIDIVFSNSDAASVTVLRNNSTTAGQISFDAPLTITVGLRPRAVTTGDFNGDGKIDIATANYLSDSVSILRNTSQGAVSFAPKTDFGVGAYAGSNPASITAGDFDGDGKTDIAAGTGSIGSVSVLRNTGTDPNTINFAQKINIAVGFGPYSILSRDFDNDGKLDIATANNSGNTISVIRNTSVTGTLSFEPRREFGVSQNPTGIAAEDFDGDGKTDLVNANYGSNTISVLKNTSPGKGSIKFGARTEIGLVSGSNPVSTAVGDFDKDGRQDLLTANLDSTFSILINQSAPGGEIKFRSHITFPGQANSTPYWVSVGDFDGDGKLDFAATNSTSGSISIFRNTTVDQNISFAGPVIYSVGSNPRYIGVGDLDADGKFDLAVANVDSNNISILRNISSGAGNINFTAPINLPVNSSPSSLVMTDLNGDGKADIAVTGSAGTMVSILKNQTTIAGSISFAGKIDIEVNSNPFSIASEDFDADGKVDLAITNHINDKYIVSILRNTGTASGDISFAAKQDFTVAVNPEFSADINQVVTGDINNDNKPDLLTINRNPFGKISVLKNNSSSAGAISFLPGVDTDTSFPSSSLITGDFNRDGKQDIAYSSYNSNNIGILSNPCTVLRNNLFDFDADRKSDTSVFRPSNSVWYLNRSADGFAAVSSGNADDKLVPADYDGDGKTDVAVYHDSNWYITRSSDNQTIITGFGAPGDIPVPADFDGDGKADISVYRPLNGVWYRLNSKDGAFVANGWGTAEDKPVIGDFDGDGKADLTVYRPSNGVWYRLNSSDNQFVATGFGAAEDLITPGDYDGDGKTDIAVYRPSNNVWYRLNSTDGSFYAVGWGSGTDKPVPADYDGDGKTDVAVYRGGTWYIVRSVDGEIGFEYFGTADDIPLPNVYVR